MSTSKPVTSEKLCGSGGVARAKRSTAEEEEEKERRKLLAQLFRSTGLACAHNRDRVTVWACSAQTFTLAVRDGEGTLTYLTLRDEMVRTFGYVAANELGGNYKYTYEWLSCLKKYLTEMDVRPVQGAEEEAATEILCRQFRDKRHPWIVHRVPFYKYYEINTMAFLEVVVGDCDVNARSTEMGPFIYRFVKLCAYLCHKDFSPICPFGHRWSVQTTVPPGTTQKGPVTPFLRVVYDCKRPECNLRLHAVLRNRPAKTHNAVYLHIFGQRHRSLSVLAKGRDSKNDNINSIGRVCTACFVEKFVTSFDKRLMERTVMKFVPPKRQAQLKTSIRIGRDLEAKVDIRKLTNADYIYGLIRRTNTSPNHRIELNPTVQKLLFQMLGFERLPFESIRLWLLHYVSECRKDPKFASGHGRDKSLFDAEILAALTPEDRDNVARVKQDLVQTFVDERSVLRSTDREGVVRNPSVVTQPSAGGTVQIRDEYALEGLEIAQFLENGEAVGDEEMQEEDIGQNDIEMEHDERNESQEFEATIIQAGAIAVVKNELPEEDDDLDENSIFSQEVPYGDPEDVQSPPSSPSAPRRRIRCGVRRRSLRNTRKTEAPYERVPMTSKNASTPMTAELSTRVQGFKSRAAAAARRSKEKDLISRTKEIQTEAAVLRSRGCQTKGFRSDVGTQTKVGNLVTDQLATMEHQQLQEIEPHLFDIKTATAAIADVATPCRSLSDLIGNDADNLFVPLHACITANVKPEISIKEFMKRERHQPGTDPRALGPSNATATCDLRDVVGREPLLESYDTAELVSINDRVYIPLASLRNS